MKNDRPIEDPRLQRALDEMKQTMARYGLAGACVLVTPDEAAFTYKLHAPWSAMRYDADADLGFRFRASSSADGKEETHRRVEAAVHTLCQISDFGDQTTMWMEDLKLMLRKNGIEFEHVPFNGKPLPHLGGTPQ